MKPSTRKLVIAAARQLVGNDKVDQILAIPFDDLGHGYDQFGQEKESGLIAWLVMRVLYESYFRVESSGHANIPAEGPGILAGNHSGFLPFDGMMVGIDLLEKGQPPRAMRAVAEYMLADVPFLSVLVSRVGQVIGHRDNFERLLDRGDIVAVFPEGSKGMGKTLKNKYQLCPFNIGFIEIALLHQVPIIPFAVVGAEEQTPVVANIDSLAQKFDLPIFPIIPTFLLFGIPGLWPLPVKYHIQYGEPVHFYEKYGPEAVEDPELTKYLAGEIRESVQQLVDQGLANRKGIFR